MLALRHDQTTPIHVCLEGVVLQLSCFCYVGVGTICLVSVRAALADHLWECLLCSLDVTVGCIAIACHHWALLERCVLA